ncbi:2847_t:CDS:1, partial [Acaulospora colombiana]
VLALAISIPLPPSPLTTDSDAAAVEENKQNDGNEASSNGDHLPTVEQFRLYEELEELEKQLELEISEDLADI